MPAQWHIGLERSFSALAKTLHNQGEARSLPPARSCPLLPPGLLTDEDDGRRVLLGLDEDLA